MKSTYTKFALVFLVVVIVLCPFAGAQKVSATRQVYLDAINEYNAFVSRKITMKQFEAKHGSFEGDRRQVLCYLAANLIAASMRDPDLWADKNDALEGKEWRHWSDIWSVELNCNQFRLR
jgi:hypothetical protein